MGWRIAITSSDGENVDQSFGRATRIYVVDLSPDGEYAAVDVLQRPPYCDQCGGTRNDLNELLRRVSGCRAVLTQKAGDFVQMTLAEHDIQIFEQSGAIKENLLKISRYYRRPVKSPA
ncbi:MAG: hypothetical protein LBP33_08645 [Candidatus Adiutrix sp.]|jgi:predicted Fe-Mo cluster-binding NifX family protein|nr:hypothetical protein [Candidatus Adiutrix sp.]